MENEFIINNITLDTSQINVITSNDKYLLVVAPAGSGKTLTIIGKIRYLIKCKNYKQEDILCISFTNEATRSLKDKLKKYFNYDIDVLTFHKVALKIIEDKKYNLASSNLLSEIIDCFFKNLIYDNHHLIKYVLRYYKVIYFKFNYLNKYKQLIYEKKIDKLKHNILVFIKTLKSNAYDSNKVKSLILNKHNYFLILCYSILVFYESELISTNSIDLDDAIKLASFHKIRRKYKYIIVDEYQDTSYLRYMLLKHLVDLSNANLMCVGDDFQSIYRFSGCSIDLFLNFDKYFTNGRIMNIDYTYRNSQQLVNVAGSFIMKNKQQITKKIISSKSISKPFKLIYYKNKRMDFTKLLFNLSGEGTLLILSRNNYDIYQYIDTKLFKIDENGFIYNKQKLIARFLSIHKAKGLESDNVILINLENDIYGFPNKLKDPKILSLINNQKYKYQYDEERRLFYVAITRSKNKVYFYLSANESCFIKELKKDFKKYLEILR